MTTVPNIFATQGGSSGVSIPASELDANFSVLASAIDTIALGNPTNLLSNTQWQINSRITLATKIAAGTVNTIAAGTVSAYSTGSNTITFSVSGVPSLKAGDLVVLAGAGIHANLKIAGTAIRVQSVSGSPVSSFVGQAPYGFAPVATGNGTVQQVATGDISGASALGPDYWQKTSTLSISLDDYTADIDPGAQRAVLLYKLGVTTAQYFYQSLPSALVVALRGQTITMRWRVKQFAGTVGGAAAFINVNGSIATGAVSQTLDAYEDVTYTATVSANATTIDVGIMAGAGNSANAFYVCKPILVVAPSLPANFYNQPRFEIIVAPSPYNKITPPTYLNASVTFPSSADAVGYYSYSFDAYGETGGGIYPTVVMLNAQAEVTTTSVGSPVAFRRDIGSAASQNFGLHPIYTQVSGVINVSAGTWPLDANGYANIYTTTSGLAVTTFSIDINQMMVSA